jgi:hypothetical protein
MICPLLCLAMERGGTADLTAIIRCPVERFGLGPGGGLFAGERD